MHVHIDIYHQIASNIIHIYCVWCRVHNSPKKFLTGEMSQPAASNILNHGLNLNHFPKDVTTKENIFFYYPTQNSYYTSISRFPKYGCKTPQDLSLAILSVLSPLAIPTTGVATYCFSTNDFVFSFYLQHFDTYHEVTVVYEDQLLFQANNGYLL